MCIRDRVCHAWSRESFVPSNTDEEIARKVLDYETRRPEMLLPIRTGYDRCGCIENLSNASEQTVEDVGHTIRSVAAPDTRRRFRMVGQRGHAHVLLDRDGSMELRPVRAEFVGDRAT